MLSLRIYSRAYIPKRSPHSSLAPFFSKMRVISTLDSLTARCSAVRSSSVERWFNLIPCSKIYGRVTVTACIRIFDNVTVDGNQRMGLLVIRFNWHFNFSQFTSRVKESLFTTSVWDRLRVAFFFALYLYGLSHSCAFFFVTLLFYLCMFVYMFHDP
jgi:hypothetical protein